MILDSMFKKNYLAETWDTCLLFQDIFENFSIYLEIDQSRMERGLCPVSLRFERVRFKVLTLSMAPILMNEPRIWDFFIWSCHLSGRIPWARLLLWFLVGTRNFLITKYCLIRKRPGQRTGESCISKIVF